MAEKRWFDRDRLSRVLELLGKRLPAEFLQSELPDLNREDLINLFQHLAKHVRYCPEWSEPLGKGQEVSIYHGFSASMYCDGAARGNPGPSGAGVLFLDQNDQMILELSCFFGSATNNEAEYKALLSGLKAAEDLGIKKLQIFLDSELVVKQVLGEYKVKSSRLLPLFRQSMARLQRLDDYAIVHVGRELNEQADRLANEAIDRGLRGGERETYRFAQKE